MKLSLSVIGNLKTLVWSRDSLSTAFSLSWWRWRRRSGTECGNRPWCFFWVLPNRSIPKPDQHRKEM